MIQKVLKVGSSAAVTLPKKSLEEMGIKIGDTVQLTLDTKNKRVVIESPTTNNKELLEWTTTFIDTYRDALESLKDK